MRSSSRALKARETTAEAVLERCLQRIAERNRTLNAFITVFEARGARAGAGGRSGDCRWAGIAVRCTASRSPSRTCSTSAARRPRPRRACGRTTSLTPMPRSIARTARRRRGLHRQDQSPRVRARNDQRGVGVRSRAASARSKPIAGRLFRRVGGVGRRRDVLRLARHRYRRIHPHPVGGLRPRRLKPTLGELSTDGCRAPERDAGSRRADCAGRWRTRRFSTTCCAGKRASVRVQAGRSPRVEARRFRATTFCPCSTRRSASAFEAACARLRDAGATLDDVAIPHAGDVAAIYLHIVLAEAAAYHAKTLERRPTTTRRTCACASRWADTSWPKTTRARCAGAS